MHALTIIYSMRTLFYKWSHKYLILDNKYNLQTNICIISCICFLKLRCSSNVKPNNLRELTLSSIPPIFQ